MISIACVLSGVVGRALVGHIEKLGPFRVVLPANDVDELVHRLDVADKLPDVCIVSASPGCIKAYASAELLARKPPRLKTIICTPVVHPLGLIVAEDCGIMGYLHTDCSDSDIATAVELVNKGERVFHPGIKEKANKLREVKKRRKKKFLSPEELRIMQFLASGLSAKQIAGKMFLSVRTVEEYFRRLYVKASVTNKDELYKLSYDIGL